MNKFNELSVGWQIAQYALVNVRPHATLGPSRLVRCRFESPVDLRRHLQQKEGFFVPGLTIAGRPGERVIVEVNFPGEGDPPLLNGWLKDHQYGGTWLDLPYARVTSRWMAGPDSPRRRHRRVACDIYAEVRPAGSPPWICRVLDLSPHGLRIGTTSMDVGVAGDCLDVTLVNRGNEACTPSLPARIAWAGTREAGLEVHQPGKEFLAILGTTDAQWEQAPVVDHGSGCICLPPAQSPGDDRPAPSPEAAEVPPLLRVDAKAGGVHR